MNKTEINNIISENYLTKHKIEIFLYNERKEATQEKWSAQDKMYEAIREHGLDSEQAQQWKAQAEALKVKEEYAEHLMNTFKTMSNDLREKA